MPGESDERDSRRQVFVRTEDYERDDEGIGFCDSYSNTLPNSKLLINL
jgi:hypothetical protein